MIERRFVPAPDLRVETRDGDAGEQPHIVGYAAVFNSPSCDLGGFIERIAPGAFADSLANGDDVRALVDHDWGRIIGRRKAGTLTLEEDERGLLTDTVPPDTSVGRDIVESIRRGDVDQMSFAFDTLEDDWSTAEDGQTIRELRKVKLWDISPVTFPAYDETSVSVSARSLFRAAGIDEPHLARIAVRAEHGLELSSKDLDLLEATIAKLRSFLPGTPVLDAARERLARFTA